MKEWISKALSLLEDSLAPIPQELNEIDWKLQISDNKKKLTQHLSAFANLPGGGVMVFGINDVNAEIVGMQDKAQIDSIIDKLSNLSRDTLSPEPKLDHAVIEYKEKTLLVIHIKESSIKPVHLKSGTIEDTFIRTGGTTRIATRQEVGSLLLNSKSLRFEDLHASKLKTKEEILSLLDYEGIYLLLQKPIPSNSEETLKWMENEKMIERIDGAGYYITNFGGIAASKDLSQFDDIARKAIRVIKYKRINKIEALGEMSGRRGYAIGFSDLIDYVIKQLPHSEVIKNALRKDTCIYPEIAIRELIANAIVHQDFTIKGKSVMIEIFDNRIEISNPGKLLPSKRIDRLIGTNPESRNEILASAFRRYGICEERGSGFEKSVTAIELYGLPPLQFEQGENYFKVTMSSPKTFAEMSQAERTEACYQHATLKYLVGSAMTNHSLRERLKVNNKGISMISRVIKETFQLGKIKLKNESNKSRKFPEYVPYWA